MARNFVVTAKEFGDGKPYLLVEPNEDIGLDEAVHITMDLPNGADIEKAKGVANFLNENLAAFRIRKI